MSRSSKKAIHKDVGFMKKDYWKTVRRVQKQALNSGKDIPNPRSIVNDYDYSDYTFDFEYAGTVDEKIKNKIKRK